APEMWTVPLKPESEFSLIGSDMDHWDAPDIVTGKAVYASDIHLPNMLYATLARCPVFGGSVASYDDSKTLQVNGVHSVHEIDGAVAVVAENTWAAIKGRQALVISWNEGDGVNLSSQGIRASLAERVPEMGSAEDGRIDAVYEFPYQAHVTMEPMNCVADVREDSCEVWAPTQNAQQVKSVVQRATRISADKITVHVPLMGGGFGRRLQTDYAFEAAALSKAVGAPLKVFWSRADDIQRDFYHPMSYQYASGDPAAVKRPNVRAQDGENIIPSGAWRSVFNHTEAFSRESFIDELAFAAGIDPVEYRLEIFSGRGGAVIELAAEKAGWSETLPENWGRGMAYFATFNVTHVAMVAEVEVNASGEVRVQRVVCAVDCGTAVNPDNIAAQMEGGIAFGLTAALKAGVTLENGRINESNFHDCPILQIDEMPVVEVHIIESDDNPSGIGEMGVPPIAPALSNAIFDATGIRVRHLPIKPEDLF
ncbi:MAG: xanthine dehydrogenase family protein molybdopterin-binding subunit, partial [Chloroflexi bacterium]|nr:xanthine dehydrogenase family protein molybdopterin-binding subunit [Chloroflexota bacterium]